MFIVFEGIDGSGTTTQANLICKRLNESGHKAIATGEPTQLEIGKLTKELLQHKWETSPEALQLLFCADRADHIWNEITPALEDHTIVISDRFFWSTIAFGGLKCDKQWLKNICDQFIKPDIIFYLKIDPEDAIKRIEKRDNGQTELFEKSTILKLVDQNFEELIKEKFKCDNIYLLNGSEPMNKICDQVYNIILQKLNNNQ